MVKNTEVYAAAGLTESEGHIYAAALHGGKMTLSQLSRASGIGKTTLYPHIDSLLRQGLLVKTIVGKRAYYAPGNPKTMLTTAERHRKQLEHALPGMLSAYQHALHAPAVSTYEGADGIRQLYEEIKNSAQYIKTFWSPRSFFRNFSLQDDAEFAARLHERGVVIQSLLEYSPESARYIRTKRDIPQKLRELPPDYAVTINTLIFGSKVALVSYENLFGLVIDNVEIARFHESLFDNLWKSLRK